MVRESSQTVLSWTTAAIKHCLSCYVPIVDSTVSINIEVGKHWICGGVEIAEHHKNTKMVGGC
jgi:hypothetical protein